MKTQTAKLRYFKVTPRKARLVCDLIKGLPVNEAEARLMLLRKRSSKALLKLLQSAVSNAKNNKLNPDKLFIKEMIVEQGPMLKRTLPRARGMATPIQKKMSHIIVVLAENPKLSAPKYKTLIPKKKKTAEHEHDHGHEEHNAEEKIKELDRKKEEIKNEEKKESPKKPGFIRRVFSPKSRASK